MILWLDHLIFGNGRGLASPYWDSRFYWLSGQLYTWIGGYGAQLRSFQWLHPKPGEIRRLANRDYKPFNSTRHGPRVDVSWCTKLPANLDEAIAELHQIKDSLGRTL